MNFKKIGWLFVSGAVLTGGLVLAQGPAQGQSIGVVHSLRALESSSAGKTAIAALRAREQKIRTDLAAVDGQISALEKRLSTQRLTLAIEEEEKVLRDIQSLRLKRKRDEEDSLKDFQRLQFNLLNGIRRDIQPIIESVAKERGLGLVLDLASESVAYAHPAFDITADVVKRYDAIKAAKK